MYKLYYIIIYCSIYKELIIAFCNLCLSNDIMKGILHYLPFQFVNFSKIEGYTCAAGSSRGVLVVNDLNLPGVVNIRIKEAMIS